MHESKYSVNEAKRMHLWLQALEDWLKENGRILPSDTCPEQIWNSLMRKRR